MLKFQSRRKVDAKSQEIPGIGRQQQLEQRGVEQMRENGGGRDGL